MSQIQDSLMECIRRADRAGAGRLLTEWARRWQRVFAGELGLNRDNATGLMRDLHQKLVYLDTGITPVAMESLLACAGFCGLPWEVQPVSLEALRGAIEEAIGRLPPPVA